MRTPSRVAALAAAVLVLGACPPPPDTELAGAPVDAPVAAPSGDPPAVPEQGGDAPPAGSSSVPSGDTRAPNPTGTTQPTAYETLRGGVAVPRCPSCGEVQKLGAEKCPGCGQAISPWRKETLCTRCVGSARCDHCGDDRACLSCDGDGACAICAGTGKVGPAQARCLECGGAGRCIACRGDGRRESVAGDFGPTESRLHGACPSCVDGSGLCPACGATGKDLGGATCLTCGGGGTCEECGGDGFCRWCAGDGACPVCDGGGHEVRNGEPRGPAERPRLIRTSAGSVLLGRVDAPPSPQGLRVVRADAGKALPTVLPRAQVEPLSWFLAVRDFPPEADARRVAEPHERAKFRFDLADLAAESGFWPLAIRPLRHVIAIAPEQAPAARARLEDFEKRRAEDWAKRADAAVKAGERERAVPLLEMAVVKARGTAIGTRAELQLLQIRRDRESDAAKLGDAEREKRIEQGREGSERAIARARLRLQRALRLLDRAAAGPADDAAADATFARAEHSASAAAALVQAEAARAMIPQDAWTTPSSELVTESRRTSATVLEAWATLAVARGRFDLGRRLARRALALQPAQESAKAILAEAERGLARMGVLEGSPPDSR